MDESEDEFAMSDDEQIINLPFRRKRKQLPKKVAVPKTEEQKTVHRLLHKSKRRKKNELDLSGECLCCTDKFTYRNRKVVCPYNCGGEACLKCHHKWLMGSAQEPHCMNCKREWSVIFMETHFPQKLLNELKDHHRSLLVIKDKSFLPQAQLVLEEQHRRFLVQEKIREHQREIDLLKSTIRQQRKTEQQEISVTKCPLEECPGFMKRGLCGLCNRRICLKCFKEKPAHENEDEVIEEVVFHDMDEDEEIKQEETKAPAPTTTTPLSPQGTHVCNPEDVANVTYLRKHTKACPCCGFRTSKISGCPQMFCMQCHKAWNWNTGREEKGIIHNPHFFEWQRRNGGVVERNPLDIQCGGLPHRLPYRPFNFSTEHYSIFENLLRCVIHVREMRVNDPRRGRHARLDNAEQLRLDFLKKKINEATWGRLLMDKHKLAMLDRDFLNIHQMFVLVGTDIVQKIQNFFQATQELSKSEELVQEIDGLRRYYNLELFRYFRLHKGRSNFQFEFIADDWNFVAPKKSVELLTRLETWDREETVGVSSSSSSAK